MAPPLPEAPVAALPVRVEPPTMRRPPSLEIAPPPIVAAAPVAVEPSMRTPARLSVAPSTATAPPRGAEPMVRRSSLSVTTVPAPVTMKMRLVPPPLITVLVESFPTMVRDLSRVIIPVARTMGTPSVLAAKSMVSPAVAVITASRRLPGPVSRLLVTVMVAAPASRGRNKKRQSVRRRWVKDGDIVWCLLGEKRKTELGNQVRNQRLIRF